MTGVGLRIARSIARLTGRPDISIVIPVYNAGRYLRLLLDSLAAQTLDPSRFEVIAVDDGSTDGSSDVLDSHAARMANLRVVHQENSGWPGIPRNRGLDLSRGRYVFFADADDVVAPEMLESLVQFADEHDCDVVLPKMSGLDGRWVGDRIYASTEVDADLELAFKTLTPQKMFRVSFLRRRKIRFPTEKVRLEDGMVMAQAYLLARRVSILADQDYYYLRARDDGQNISRGDLDAEGYTSSVAVIAQHVRRLDRDPERAERIILDLYRRKCLKIYRPDRWLHYRRAKKESWLAAHGAFAEDFISPELEATLPERWLWRSRAARSGSVEFADRSAVRERQLSESPEAFIGVGDDGEPELRLALLPGGGYESVDLVARRRGSKKTRTIPAALTKAAEGSGWADVAAVRLPAPDLVTKPGVVDFSVVCRVDGIEGELVRLQVRADAPGLFEPTVRQEDISGRWYATAKGNLSFDVR